MGYRFDRPGVVLLGSDFKALGVVRSLGRRGIPSMIIDNQPRAAWFSRYVVARIRWPAWLDDPALIELLTRLSESHHLKDWVLMPTQDEAVSLVAHHHEWLASHFRLATPSWVTARWALDKRLTHSMARELDVPYPATWYPSGVDYLNSPGVSLPVIIKPAISVHLQYAARLKALPAHSADELRAQYASAARILSPDEIMIQEIIPGGGDAQYSVAAFCVDGSITASMTARRTRQYPIDFGLSSSYVESVDVPILIGPAARILQFMRMTGMVELEFKYDKRYAAFKLLDINIRPWGWHTLCIACGLDFPYIQYRYLIDDPLAVPAPRYGPRWLRALTDLPAAFGELRRGTLTIDAYLRSLAGPTVFSVLDWRDPLPTLGDGVSAVVRAIWRARARRSRAQVQTILQPTRAPTGPHPTC